MLFLCNLKKKEKEKKAASAGVIFRIPKNRIVPDCNDLSIFIKLT